MGKTVENYLILQPLGQGNFAKVFKAKNIKTGQDFAIKVIPAQKFKDIPKLEQCTVNQISILSQIRNESDYIVNYIDMLKTANNFYFVYEYCNGGTLDKLIQKQGYFPEQKACKILRQILQGFKVLNKHNIMHRDLKPENILIHNGTIKIADFSFCKLLENKDELTQTMLGSPIYMAPQVLRGQIYTMKADIWSIGIVFYKMLIGKCPYQSKSIALLIKLLQKQDLQFPIQPKISRCAQQFLRRVLVKDPNQRINWDQIFNTFHITQTGQIINKKDLLIQQQQTQLRQSVKNNNINQNGSFSFNNIRVTYPVNINGNPNPNYIPSPQINTSGGQMNTISMNINQMNLVSPKSNIVPQNQTKTLQSSYQHIQSPTIDKNLVASKSPFKDHEQRNPNNFRTSGNNFNSSLHTGIVHIVQNNSNISHNYRSISGTNQNPSYFSSQPNLGSNTQFTKPNTQTNSKMDQITTQNKTQRLALSRIEILTKNHAKCIQINQIVLQILSLQQQYANYICYFVFKGICKQIQALYQNLRKQSITDQTYRQFRTIIQSELNNINKIINNFYQTIQEDQKQNQLLTDNKNKNLDQQIFDNKQKILKLYIENLNDSDQHIRLASQVVDYIEENILIKRDAYQRMGRDHLYKQMKNKVFKE